MKHIDFEIELYAYEDDETVGALHQVCERNDISRTFSNWEQLSSVWDIMHMLGYTIQHQPPTDERRKYRICSWFGNDSDEAAAYQIACSIQDL